MIFAIIRSVDERSTMIEMHHKTRWTTTSALAAALICSCVGSAARGQDSKTEEADYETIKGTTCGRRGISGKGSHGFSHSSKTSRRGGQDTVGLVRSNASRLAGQGRRMDVPKVPGCQYCRCGNRRWRVLRQPRGARLVHDALRAPRSETGTFENALLAGKKSGRTDAVQLGR